MKTETVVMATRRAVLCLAFLGIPMHCGAQARCTLPGSRIENTGVYELITLPNGPVPGQADYRVCNNPNVWNIAQDLEVGVQLNPYRGWTLMGMSPVTYSSASFVQLANYVEQAYENGQLTYKSWKMSIPESMAIGIFGEGAKPEYVIGEILPFKKGMVYLATGSLAGVPAGVVVKWTGGFSGEIKIVGSVWGVYRAASPCGNGARWALQKNDTQLASGEMIPEYGDAFRVNSVSVNSTDSIYFVFDPKGEAACDGSALDLEITRLNPPIPPNLFENGYEK